MIGDNWRNYQLDLILGPHENFMPVHGTGAVASCAIMDPTQMITGYIPTDYHADPYVPTPYCVCN